MDNQKYCPKCQQNLPATTDFFYAHPQSRDKLQGHCKQCHKNENHKRYQNRPKGWAAERARIHRAQRPDLARARQRRYYEKHRETILQKSRDRDQLNRQAHSDRVKQWRRKNPDKARIHVERRRARRQALSATLTSQEWLDILESFGYACAYCGQRNMSLVQEHVIPVTQGGGYTKDNIVPACRSCNSKKGPRTPEQAHMSLIRDTSDIR